MGTQPPIRLILASGSRGRRYLLSREGYSFEIIPSNVDEPTQEKFSDVRSLVQHIAWLKAAAVAPRVLPKSPGETCLVLAADTVGWIDGQVIGKPNDVDDARRILNLLSGKEHELWTGVCLWRCPGNLQFCWQEMSRVYMNRMSEHEREGYLESGVWEGCSGAYAIREDGDDPLVTVAQGSRTNVIGLPMESLKKILSQAASVSS